MYADPHRLGLSSVMGVISAKLILICTGLKTCKTIGISGHYLTGLVNDSVTFRLNTPSHPQFVSSLVTGPHVHVCIQKPILVRSLHRYKPPLLCIPHQPVSAITRKLLITTY